MSDLSELQVASMRERVSREEWATRVDLAACYRLVHHYGMDDLVYNHISARVPGEEGHFLINAYGMTYDEISASSLVKIDFDGKIVQDSGTGYGINHAGFVIHSAIHRARHDVACVIHTHTPAGMAVSAMDCGLLPLTQNSMFFSSVGMHGYEGPAVDLDEQKRLVTDLGTSVKGEGSDASPAEQVVSLIKKNGGSAVASTDSVADWTSANRIVQCALDSFGRLDVVVNNAGILRDRFFFNLSPEDWRAV